MDAPGLSHVDRDGNARMVDVADKPVTDRFAHARAHVRVAPATASLIATGGIAKGDVIATARLAGIMAAKRTDELIPLCHSISLDHVNVEFDVQEQSGIVTIDATARTSARTGVEMEAMVACTISAATVYDMVKSVDRAASIEQVMLIEKRGGRSGTITVNDRLPVQ